jgi:two-component system, sensor histidine kinase PdtaS
LGEGGNQAIVVQAASLTLPNELAVPLGLIVTELITNSAKHAAGHITVRLEPTSPGFHTVAVLDDGPGLAEGFDPENSTGLGMKIVLSYVNCIGGELEISPGDGGRGSRFAVSFRAPDCAAS